MNFFFTITLFFVANFSYCQQVKWYSTKTFGTVGDGITDNTKAFEKIFEFNKANRNVGFVLPNGRYYISKHFYVADKFLLKGQGNSTLIMGNGITGNLFHIYDKASGTKFINVFFDSEKNNSAPELVRFDGINDIEFIGCKFVGPRTIWFNNVKNIIIERTTFRNLNTPTSPNLICNFVNSHNIKVLSNNFHGGGGVQFITACSDIEIKDNTLLSMTAYPIHFVFDSPTPHKNVFVLKNKLIGNGKMAYHGGSYDQVSCFKVENLKIADNTITSSGDMGITLAHCRNVIIFNNIVTKSNTSAISIINVFNCLVENNRFENNGIRESDMGIDPKARAGIYFYTESLETGCDSILIYNNKISFSDRTRKYYTLSVNGPDKKFIKVYIPGLNTFPVDENYTSTRLKDADYKKWRKILFEKVAF